MVDYIKQICFDMIGEISFSDIVFGTVISIEPITVKISDKLILNENQLVLSRNVSDFTAEFTENPEFSDNPSNPEDFKKRKKYIVYNSLKAGEKVIMTKAMGGQLYFIMERVYTKDGGD